MVCLGDSTVLVAAVSGKCAAGVLLLGRHSAETMGRKRTIVISVDGCSNRNGRGVGRSSLAVPSYEKWDFLDRLRNSSVCSLLEHSPLFFPFLS